MKDNDKMIYAIAISSAVASGILNYKQQTMPPEPTPVVQTVEQPKPTDLNVQHKLNNNK
jgi:hypothetical protein